MESTCRRSHFCSCPPRYGGLLRQREGRATEAERGEDRGELTLKIPFTMKDIQQFNKHKGVSFINNINETMKQFSEI
jgi:hypothetical protein